MPHEIYLFYRALSSTEGRLRCLFALFFSSSHFWEIFSGRTETLLIARTLDGQCSVVLSILLENRLFEFAMALQASDGAGDPCGNSLPGLERRGRFSLLFSAVRSAETRCWCDTCVRISSGPISQHLAAACRFRFASGGRRAIPLGS